MLLISRPSAADLVFKVVSSGNMRRGLGTPRTPLGESALLVGPDRLNHCGHSLAPEDIDGPVVQVGIVALQPKSRLSRSERCAQVPGQGVQVSKLHQVLLVRYFLTQRPAAGFASTHSE
jgi:hypothetical protein